MGLLTTYKVIDFKQPRTGEPREPSLDGFRGAAALSVAVWHAFILPLDRHSLALDSCYSWFFITRSGVDMFFVLSGFLISGVLLRNWGSPSYFRAFYVRRLFRIAPMYFLLIAIAAAGPLLVPSETLFRGRLHLWPYGLFIQNYFIPGVAYSAPILAATWSLAVEEQFYLFFPAVIRWVDRRMLLAAFLGLIGFSVCLRFVLTFMGPDALLATYFVGICRLDSLAIGAVVAYLAAFKPGIIAGIYRFSRRWIFIAVFSICLAGRLMVHKVDLGMARWGYFWVGLVYGLLLIHALSQGSLIRRLFALRVLRGIGQVSYGFYLFQWPCLWVVWHWNGGSIKITQPSDALISLLGICAALALSVVCYYTFERRLADLGRNLGTYKRVDLPPLAVPVAQ